MIEVGETGITKEGIKGPSAMMSFEYFDLVYSFLIDYMHAALLGVLKLMMELWFGSTNSKTEFYLGNLIERIEEKLLGIKVPKFINRPPVDIRNFSTWKANQFRCFLLYYCYEAFFGIMEKKYFDNLLLLSSAIYTFSKDFITERDFEEASKNITEFVKQFETLYGAEHMNFNVHLMLHLPNTVKKFGPCWSYSMFSYESKNGFLTKTLSGTSQVVKELARKYIVISEHQKSKNYNEEDENYKLPKGKITNDKELATLVNTKEIIRDYKYVIKNKSYLEAYNHHKKTFDSLIILKNGDVGTLLKIFTYDQKIKLLFEKTFKIMSKRHQFNFIKVLKRADAILVDLCDVDQKLILVNNYYCSIPNIVEGD